MPWQTHQKLSGSLGSAPILDKTLLKYSSPRHQNVFLPFLGYRIFNVIPNMLFCNRVTCCKNKNITHLSSSSIICLLMCFPLYQFCPVLFTVLFRQTKSGATSTLIVYVHLSMEHLEGGSEKITLLTSK